MSSRRACPGPLLKANLHADTTTKDAKITSGQHVTRSRDPRDHQDHQFRPSDSSISIPQVNTLDEALNLTLSSDLILRIRTSVAILPSLYNEYKAEFDAFGQTLMANLERIPALPVYCKVAGSFKKKGIVKVIQRLVVDGYIEPISLSKERIKMWPLVESDVYSALPDILNRLLRPGLLSRATTPLLSEVEGEEIMKRSIALTCYQLKHINNEKKTSENIIIEEQSASTERAALQKVLELEEIERRFINLDDTNENEGLIPMDLCPFDDTVISSDENDVIEPPIKLCSNIEHFYNEVFGPLEKIKGSDDNKKDTCAADSASSHTEVSTPLLSISSSVSEQTVAAFVIPAFKNCPSFKKYPSVKFYREFIRELYSSLYKAQQKKHPTIIAVPPKVIEGLMAPHHCKNTRHSSGKNKNIVKIMDTRSALEGYIGRGKKGNAFYNIQPKIMVNDKCYIHRSELLQTVSAYQTTLPLISMLKHYYEDQSMTTYMQRISTIFELAVEEVIILNIESFKFNNITLHNECWIGFCCILVRKVGSETTIIVPYLPLGVSRVGSFILTGEQTANTISNKIYPGSFVRSPVARYDSSLGGMQLTLLQSTVVNIKQNSLVIVAMDIRDPITDALSSKKHNLLNVPRDGEILCHSSNIFMRSIWDIYLTSNSEDSIMLPQRLCGRSVCDVQTNKKMYMTDYLYTKRLQKTKLFRTLDCTTHAHLGHRFQLMQMESAREAICKAKISDANEVVICENSLFILSALMIHPALICLLETDDGRDVQTIFDLASDNSIYINPKKIEAEVRNILKRYEAEQEDCLPSAPRALAYDAIKTYFSDLLILYAP